MRVIISDEYGQTVYSGDTDMVPRIGERVSIGDDEPYIVKSVNWFMHDQEVLITVSQNAVRQAPPKEDTRLGTINSAIMQITERQDRQEKRTRLLTESLQTVRTTLKNISPGKK